ncbi:MAG: hypothetical protein QOE26_1365 [Verrucomicrobiota bacterium]|jgi:RHS repeat-associated protein
MNLRFLSLSLVTFVCIGLAPQAFAQAGNDNPGGVTAEYHGSITTAGYYDPYTGNAKREIDDIVVPGSIGAYPLKYTRTFNTRGSAGWTHNYQWSLWVRPPDEDLGNGDGFYDGPVRGIQYPNGGHFDTIVYDSPWFIEASGPHGASDQLVTCASGACTPGSGAAYELWRADGGKVLFEHVNGYRGYAIIDPYGQQTTLSYDGSGKLWKVTEPGGRYLEFVYQTFTYWYPWPDSTHNAAYWASEVLLSAVRANDGRGNTIETVSYGYEWVWQGHYYPEYVPYLNHAYYDDTAQATYTYADANNYDTPGTVYHGHTRRVLKSCDDPRYAGQMKYIEYEYVPWTETTSDPYFIGRGQIKAEKNVYGQIVSRTTYPTSTTDPNLWRRTETRGDGAGRTLTYGATGLSWTDFQNKTWTEADSFTSSFYGWTVTDPRMNTTKYERNDLDAVRNITYPQTDLTGAPATREYSFDPNNPYLHSGEKDENGYWTYFQRDASNRVTLITYPDTSTERFTYNNLGQVLTHTLRSGGTEHFEYYPDNRGLKSKSWPPATLSDPNPQDHPTLHYYYTSGPNTDRLYMVIDPRGNATAYEYNQRGQITKVQHQDGTYIQSAYNLDGSLAWTADENHPNAGLAGHENERTRYTYDEYKRVLTVTNPMGETTTNYYGLDWANPLLHTTNTVKYTLSPMSKNVVFDYDENLRKKDQVVALGTADESWTLFEYDEVGNLKKTTDPRWNVTTYGYDQRNRKIWTDSAIGSDRSTTTGHTMTLEYDGVGNKTKETRADNAFRSWIYDIPNRITSAIDWRLSASEPAITTTYERNVTSTIETTKDAKDAVYTFTFDAVHRKITETYPTAFGNSSPNEAFWYDAVGNLILYKSPAGQYKHLDYADSYDSRNRLRHAGWNLSASSGAADWSVGQEIRTNYDAASRMTSITTNNGETTVAFGYDDANRKLWEDQTLAGYPTRGVVTPHDADGNRENLEMYTGGVLQYGAYYDYTQRNQLQHIYWDSNQTPWITYSYDAAGNMIKRQDTRGGVNDSTNVPSSYYDGLNRPTMWEQTGASDVPFARSWYKYDTVGREVATWRDEEGNKGERFTYDATNQVTHVSYKADNVSTGPAVNAVTEQQYDYTADKLNRSSVTENGVVTNYAMNGMNQYTSVGGQGIQYDGNFNFAAMGGWQYSYDADNRLTSLANPAPQAGFVYDGLGRCVKRTIQGATKVVTYDDWKPIMEWSSPTQLAAWNAYGPGADEILWRWQAGFGYLRYHSDMHGNVTALLDYWGGLVEKYSYDAFGKPTIMDGSGTPYPNPHGVSAVGNRFMFQGREWLGELGLIDYRHRFYDPSMGRFLQTDPMGLQTEGAKLSAGQKALFSPGGSAPEAFSNSEMNLFRYCGDDPVDGSDPTGLETLTRPEIDRQVGDRVMFVSQVIRQMLANLGDTYEQWVAQPFAQNFGFPLEHAVPQLGEMAALRPLSAARTAPTSSVNVAAHGMRHFPEGMRETVSKAIQRDIARRGAPEVGKSVQRTIKVGEQEVSYRARTLEGGNTNVGTATPGKFKRDIVKGG